MLCARLATFPRGFRLEIRLEWALFGIRSVAYLLYLVYLLMSAICAETSLSNVVEGLNQDWAHLQHGWVHCSKPYQGYRVQRQRAREEVRHSGCVEPGVKLLKDDL